jgi:Lipocalin-like domain
MLLRLLNGVAIMAVSSTQENPLLGTWKLISASAVQSNGITIPDIYGTHPTGYITYTADGYMSVMFSRRDRLPLSQQVQSPLSRELSDIPVEELAHAFSSFNAYAGTYSLNRNTVTHHLEVASIPNRVGTDLIRTFTVSENRVILKTAPVERDGILQTFELVWERVEPKSPLPSA